MGSCHSCHSYLSMSPSKSNGTASLDMQWSPCVFLQIPESGRVQGIGPSWAKNKCQAQRAGRRKKEVYIYIYTTNHSSFIIASLLNCARTLYNMVTRTYALTCAAQTGCPDVENLGHAKHPHVHTTKHKCLYADGQYEHLNTEFWWFSILNLPSVHITVNRTHAEHKKKRISKSRMPGMPNVSKVKIKNWRIKTCWRQTPRSPTPKLCRKCVCLDRGDAKQFSAKTRKPENAKTDRKTRKPRKRENRENGTFIQWYMAKVIEDDVLKAQHEGWSGICSKDHYHIII